MKKIVVGSRESRLAVVQSMSLIDHLRATGCEVELLTMKTTGDKILDRTLDKVGGKGLFVRELDAALLEGRADLAVHCVKDLPMELAPGTAILGYSRREDARDALVLPPGADRIPKGGVIGTSSLRRALQLKKLFPECEIRPVRGNLITRLDKLDAREYDALVLAVAGLNRLGLDSRISYKFETDEIIPAAGQGILAVVGRVDGEHPDISGYMDQNAAACAECERAFVRELDGGCTSPVCANATVSNGRLFVRALYWNPDTGETRVGADSGPAEEAVGIGVRLAQKLRDEKEAQA